MIAAQSCLGVAECQENDECVACASSPHSDALFEAPISYSNAAAIYSVFFNQ